MADPTLGGVNMGNVSGISFGFRSDLDVLSFPGTASSTNLVFEMGGVERTISVSGNFTGSTTAAVKTLVDALQALINASQSSSVAFVSDECGTIQVKIASFDVKWERPSNRAEYSLQILEGS